MELRHLRYIVAAARSGSFSAAAHEFNVRQPIVSKRIKEAEDELGVSLFDRSTSGARLTQAGEAFLDDARRIIDGFEQLCERTKASGASVWGRIVIGFYKSLSTGALVSFVRAFRRRYPEIDVELVEAPLTEITAGLHSGRVDVAIVLGEAGKCPIFESIALWSEHLVVALPREHPLTTKTIIYWPELKHERFLITHHDPGLDIRVVLLRHLAAPSDSPVIVARRLSRESILCEVAHGQGVAPQCASAMGLTSLGVVFRPVHDGGGATRLGYIACWRPDNTNPILTTFIDALKSRD